MWLTLRHRRADGTTHLRFDPLELLERLVVLTPRPRVNLILYYGVLAPRGAWRSALVLATADDVDASDGESSGEPDGDTGRSAVFTGRRRVSMGRVDAAHVRGRCPGVSPLRWATAPRGVRSEGTVRTRLIAVDNRRAEMNHLRRDVKASSCALNAVWS